MAEHTSPSLPSPTPEQRRVAVGQYERANQVIQTGNLDYGIQLLLTCCKLEPTSLTYRQALRHTQKLKHKNNLRGSRFAFLTTSPIRTRMKAARSARDYAKVLECGEEILVHNPWDVATQMDMSEAAEALGVLDLAVWMLEQARQKDPQDAVVNRALARLYEKRGNFSQAISLWELVRKADPKDVEAAHKGKDLAASATIAKGGYEAAIQGKSQAPMGSTTNGRKELEAEQAQDRPNSATVSELRIQREAATLRAKIEGDPTNPVVYLQLASFYRRNGKFDQARTVLMEGLGPTGNDFELTVELAEVEIEPFRQNLALTEQRIQQQPRDQELSKIRERLQKEINTREMDYFRQKADRYPSEMAHRLELGTRLLKAGQVDAAILELQAARSDPRMRWKALMYLGFCFKSRNNWRLAQRNLEEALQNLPGGEEEMRKELLFQLASGLAEAGDLARAVELAYDLANLDFAYKDIGRLIDTWQEKLQKA